MANYNLLPQIEAKDNRYQANIYLFKVNNRNNRKGCKICSKLTKKHFWRRSGVFIVNLTYFPPSCSFSIVEFEQVNISWDYW